MEIKQYCLLLFTTVLAILVVDARSGTQKDKMSLRCLSTTCNYTDTDNTVKCVHPENWISCPAHLQNCITGAKSPNFTSTLSCGAASNKTCSLQHSSTQAIELTCTCSDNLCNQPFSVLLRNQLINFIKNSNNNKNFTKNEIEKFLSALPQYIFAKQHERKENDSKMNDVNIDVPRAEALKHDGTAPSDDDEDESEGSGAYDETRIHSVPAAPSSYLPAEKSNAVRDHLNILLAITFIYNLV